MVRSDNDSLISVELRNAVQRISTHFTEHLLIARVHQQQLFHLRAAIVSEPEAVPDYQVQRNYLISTSRFGIGQVSGSNCTPLGLHRIAEKIGAPWPAGTVFKARQPIGFTWNGMPDAKITTRILWLEGLEEGLNRGGNVDSHDRYIYIHGVGDQSSVGKPSSHGCIHLADKDLVPLFEIIPSGTLVWIEA